MLLREFTHHGKLLKGFIGLLHKITEYSGYLQASKFTIEVLRTLISLLTDLTSIECHLIGLGGLNFEGCLARYGQAGMRLCS